MGGGGVGVCILNSGFGPIIAFNLFKRFGKAGV